MFIVFKPEWVDKHGRSHRCMTISGVKAEQILKYHRDPPGDLSEEQYDMLSCIHKIYQGRPSKPASEPVENKESWGVAQGKSEILPRGDR